MDKDSDWKQKTGDTRPVDETNPEETAESRSERYRKRVEAIRDYLSE